MFVPLWDESLKVASDRHGACRWNEISEQALFYARTQTFARLKKDKV